MNILLIILMATDKYKAKKHKWRIKEKTLFSISLLGGCIGGFIGMFLFHHKTKKPLFYLIFSVSLLIHTLIVFYINKI